MLRGSWSHLQALVRLLPGAACVTAESCERAAYHRFQAANHAVGCGRVDPGEALPTLTSLAVGWNGPTHTAADRLGGGSVRARHLSTEASAVSGKPRLQDLKHPVEDAPLPRAQQQDAQQQQREGSPQGTSQGSPHGWDDEAEPQPIPLDPDVNPPGMLFVSTGALLSALLAVGVAALGVLGTFYAGYAISQVAKELRAAPGGTGGDRSQAAASPVVEKATAASRSGAQSIAASAGLSSASAEPSQAANKQPAKAPNGGHGTQQGGAPPDASGRAAGVAGGDAAGKRRTWQAWLREIRSRWSRRRQEPADDSPISSGTV